MEATKYHQTTVLHPKELAEYNDKAKAQDELVMWLFKAFNNSGLTPSKVWQDLISLGKIDRFTPITSVRRSMTNLTDEGFLEKTDEQTKGFYGRPEHIWRLPVRITSTQQPTLFG